MFDFLRVWLDRRVIKRSTITEEQWTTAFAAIPLLQRLTADEKHRLQDLAILFLHQKEFVGANGLTVTQPMTLIIALQACFLVLNLGLGGYDGWSTVIVYPAGFAPRRTIIDKYGIEHTVQSSLSGEAWQRGPVVLSWTDSERAGVIDGQHLLIHEFAHKLDMQNGVANGFPPLHADMNPDVWVEAFSAGYQELQTQCKRGEDIGINCYAASEPAEYFAVVSEVFFESSEILRKHSADVYDQLRQYYRQDPLARQ